MAQRPCWREQTAPPAPLSRGDGDHPKCGTTKAPNQQYLIFCLKSRSEALVQRCGSAVDFCDSSCWLQLSFPPLLPSGRPPCWWAGSVPQRLEQSWSLSPASSTWRAPAPSTSLITGFALAGGIGRSSLAWPSGSCDPSSVIPGAALRLVPAPLWAWGLRSRWNTVSQPAQRHLCLRSGLMPPPPPRMPGSPPPPAPGRRLRQQPVLHLLSEGLPETVGPREGNELSPKEPGLSVHRHRGDRRGALVSDYTSRTDTRSAHRVTVALGGCSLALTVGKLLL